MLYYVQPQLWAPVTHDRILAVLLPQQHREIPSQEIYLRLLKYRVEWLIRQRQEDCSLTLMEDHEWLRQSLSLLNPLAPTQPMLPPRDTENYRPWRRAWATALVEESGAIHQLLALTQTQFPQVVAPVGRRTTLLQLFQPATLYSMKEWLGELVYQSCRGGD